jgi:hypothetical protein
MEHELRFRNGQHWHKPPRPEEGIFTDDVGMAGPENPDQATVLDAVRHELGSLGDRLPFPFSDSVK